MELSSLAAKQKRALDWAKACAQTDQKELRQRFETWLTSYRQLLAACWEKGEVTPDDERTMTNLERILQELEGESRICLVARG